MWFTEVYITNIFVKLTVCFVCVCVCVCVYMCARASTRVGVCSTERRVYNYVYTTLLESFVTVFDDSMIGIC